ncbi:hypothetical protein [Streptomyces noursei]|uniref:hypothetical protein n=1 Tax=Streptomyces noursei TaxID=1971 RepID=UPI0023B7DEA0|nr:hypothetical protein [Streptomyces noursei]
MKTNHRRASRAVVAAAAATLCLAGAGQAQAAALGSVTFYTGADRTGTAVQLDLAKVGVCQELTAPARSFYAASNQSVDVFFNKDCTTGAPGQAGDLYFRTGTLGQGNFPYAAVSYRIRSTG